MSNTNWLANIFDTAGEVFEKFNPAAFRFLAAFLPYLTPVPVAWVSQSNATKFLNLPPQVSFIFVFGLEGIGLWFTALFVDSIVTAIRSRNWKSWITVAMFTVAVVVYVTILVNINVIIEQSSGKNDPAYSRVITLLCFLPLITGIGNGYYKLILESKTNIEKSKELEDARARQEHQEKLELEEKARQDRLVLEDAERKERAESNERDRLERLEKYKIKYGNGFRNDYKSSNATSRTKTEVPEHFQNTSRTGRKPVHQERVFSYINEQLSLRGVVPSFTEITNNLNLPQSTVSRLRNEWLSQNG